MDNSAQTQDTRHQRTDDSGCHRATHHRSVADASELYRLSIENKALQSLVAEWEETQAEVKRLTKAAEVAKADYARLEDRLAEVKVRLAEAELAHQMREAKWLSERDTLKEQIQDLKANAQILEERLANRSELVERLGQERDTLLAEIKGLSETVHAKAVEVARVTAQREGLAEDKGMLTQQAERLTAELTRLNRQNSLLSDKLEALHAQLEGKRSGK